MSVLSTATGRGRGRIEHLRERFDARGILPLTHLGVRAPRRRRGPVFYVRPHIPRRPSPPDELLVVLLVEPCRESVVGHPSSVVAGELKTFGHRKSEMRLDEFGLGKGPLRSAMKRWGISFSRYLSNETHLSMAPAKRVPPQERHGV